MKPVILFESYPDFSGSPLEIYNELVKRGYDKKYDLIWAVYSTFNEKTNYKVVKFHGSNSQEKQEILARTKVIIDSNRYIYKPRPDVFRLHTRHGTNLKRAAEYSRGIGPVDAMLSISEAMANLDRIIYPEQVASKDIITGLPANDRLFDKVDLYENGFIKEVTGTDNHFSKIIGWFPTYRQHRVNKAYGTDKILPFALPCIKTREDLLTLNEYLKKFNMLLLVQIHHAQAKNYQTVLGLSNIKYIDNDIEEKFNISMFGIFSNLDALITDYSAAYYEYLLLNRPIALGLEDLIEFNDKFGFWYNYLKCIKGEYLLNFSDVVRFIIDIGNGIDRSLKERTYLLNLVHKYHDNKSTERVVNYLEGVLGKENE